MQVMENIMLFGMYLCLNIILIPIKNNTVWNFATIESF